MRRTLSIRLQALFLRVLFLRVLFLRVLFLRVLLPLGASLLTPTSLLAAPPLPVQVVTIDARAPARPFPHFWERMFGSGRAILALRESWQRDLREVKAATDLAYVRFHGIFLDEVGVYGVHDGHPVTNFQYVDAIYDAVLASGARPFIEISFMPRALARDSRIAPFWYAPIVSLPADYGKWDALVTDFARHLVNRYGIDEVARWYFEVWNEPNLDRAVPQAAYFELYDHTARAVKRASDRLRVGGPATAQGAWVGATIDHAVRMHVPLDFISTHTYGDDVPDPSITAAAELPPYGSACPTMRLARETIRKSARPDLPLMFTEANATWRIWDPVLTDQFIGTWLAATIRQCDGVVDMMAYWVFSDVFEEPGIMPRPFEGGFGLLTIGGIPKPSFTAFRLLHRLGNRRLANAAANVLVTRHDDGRLVVAVWNRVAPGRPDGAIDVRLVVDGVAPGTTAKVWRADAKHGDARELYAQLGSPVYPTPPQLEKLRAAALLETPETLAVTGLRLRLPANALALVEIPASYGAAPSP